MRSFAHIHGSWGGAAAPSLASFSDVEPPAPVRRARAEGPTTTTGEKKWWEALIETIPSIFGGGKTPTPGVTTPETPKKNNTALYVGIGCAVLLVVGLIIILVKTKKK